MKTDMTKLLFVNEATAIFMFKYPAMEIFLLQNPWPNGKRST